MLTSIGQNRIDVLKLVRELTRLSLTDAKALVDAVATGPQRVLRSRTEDVQTIKKILQEAGASVDIKPVSKVGAKQKG